MELPEQGAALDGQALELFLDSELGGSDLGAAASLAPVKRRRGKDNPRASVRWTGKDDEALRSFVAEHGPKDWRLIAVQLGREHTQCMHRWKNPQQ